MLSIDCSHLQVFSKLIKCFICMWFVNVEHMHKYDISLPSAIILTRFVQKYDFPTIPFPSSNRNVS